MTLPTPDCPRIPTHQRRITIQGYPTGMKITDAELTRLNLKLADFHGDWNYTLLPLRKKN